MKKYLPGILGWLAVNLLLLSSAFADTTVIVNVNVIPMTHEVVMPQQSVVIVDGKIGRIGHVDEVPIPKASVIVTAQIVF